MGLIEMKKFTFEQWKIFSFTAFFLTVQIVSALLALPLVAIATMIVFRNISTCIVALIDWLVFKREFTVSAVAALVMTTVGMLVYAWNDINYNFMGYIWLLVNAVVTVMNTFWNKIYISAYAEQKKQTTQGISLIQQTETLPLIIALV